MFRSPDSFPLTQLRQLHIVTTEFLVCDSYACRCLVSGGGGSAKLRAAAVCGCLVTLVALPGLVPASVTLRKAIVGSPYFLSIIMCDI